MIHIHVWHKIDPAAWKKAMRRADVGAKAYKRCRCGEKKEYTLVSRWDD